MPYNLPLASIAQKNLIASDTTYLILLEVDVKPIDSNTVAETLYLANNDESFTFNGIEYVAYPFDMSLNQEAGSQPTLQLTAHDVTRAIQQRMQGYNGGVGWVVRFMIVHQDQVDGIADINETFEIINSSSKDYTVTFNLGTANLLDKQFPARRQLRSHCAWRYKDERCKYTGALASCDYTMNGANGCAVHNNSINFGGFPGLVSNGLRYV